MSRLRRWRRGGVAALGSLLAGGAVLVITAAPASAHVTIAAPNATVGGYVTATLNVPTESQTAATTGLRLSLPTNPSIASVRVQPKPGWRVSVRTRQLPAPASTADGQQRTVVAEIDWTATGAGIPPGQFDQFAISLGPLPDQNELVFGAIQHYGDGHDVAWVERATGGAEPEHPAPTLRLIKAVPTSTQATAPASRASSGHGFGLAVTALVCSLVALAVGAVSLTRSRRRATGDQ